MIGQPDIEGLKSAQVRLRSAFGKDVTFYTPMETEWPPGTVLDPESGRPYDPLIEPVASGFSSAVVKCNVAHRPVQGLGENVDETAIGDIPVGECVLIMGNDDYASIADAVAFDVLERNWKLKDARPDGIGPDEHRVLIWGERQGDPWQ